MTHQESISNLLDEIKSCPSSAIATYFSPVMSQVQYLGNDEKINTGQSFYNWAVTHEAEEPLKCAYAEFFLGLACHLSDQNERALQLFMKSKKCFEELNDGEGQGLCASLIGSVYRTLGYFDLALKILWEGFGLLKETKNYQITLSAATNSIANINLELHNYDEASTFFNITLDTSIKTNDYYFRIYALHGLGKVKYQQHQFDDAKKYLEEALELAETNKSPMAISNSLSELANFYFKRSELSQAEELNQRALLIRDEHHLTGAAVTSSINLGEIYIKQQRWDEAEKILNDGLKIANEIKVKPKIYRIHFLLSEIYRRRNEWQKSLEAYERFHSIREEVEREDSARKLADAKLIFEAELTKKENVIIKKQKQEIEKKNIELQDTIDELTLTRVSRKAKALTLILAIVLFIFEDPIVSFALKLFSSESYLLEMVIKITVIFSLNPINRIFESYLLKRVIMKKKEARQLATDAVGISTS